MLVWPGPNNHGWREDSLQKDADREGLTTVLASSRFDSPCFNDSLPLRTTEQLNPCLINTVGE